MQQKFLVIANAITCTSLKQHKLAALCLNGSIDVSFQN